MKQNGKIASELDFVFIATDGIRFIKKQDAQKHQDKLNEGKKTYDIFSR